MWICFKQVLAESPKPDAMHNLRQRTSKHVVISRQDAKIRKTRAAVPLAVHKTIVAHPDEASARQALHPHTLGGIPHGLPPAPPALSTRVPSPTPSLPHEPEFSAAPERGEPFPGASGAFSCRISADATENGFLGFPPAPALWPTALCHPPSLVLLVPVDGPGGGGGGASTAAYLWWNGVRSDAAIGTSMMKVFPGVRTAGVADVSPSWPTVSAALLRRFLRSHPWIKAELALPATPPLASSTTSLWLPCGCLVGSIPADKRTSSL